MDSHRPARAWSIGLAALLFCAIVSDAMTPVHAQDAPAPVNPDAQLLPEFVDDEPVAPESGYLNRIFEALEALGPWTAPFLAATLIAVWFTTERLVVLRPGRVVPKSFVDRFLSLLAEGELDPDEALEICEDNDSPVAHVFAHGVRKWGKPSVEVEQAIIDGGERQVSSLRKHLRVINGVATVTPLIGLLGTVWGMLGAFKGISTPGVTANTQEMASEIALALVTTAAGLVIAIPSLIAYMYLSGRVDSLVMRMDDLAQKVVHCVSGEALQERASRPRTALAPKASTPPKKKAV
jgi:biopolymer transport protein ExbB